MAVKRVTDSYTRGIQAIANARRTLQPQGARAPTHKPAPQPRPIPAKAPEQPEPNGAREAGAEAIATIAADIAKLQLAARPAGERLAPIDYRDIIANTVATLDNSTVEARHAVYECARQVVYQRLARIRPALSPELIDRERVALDQAIDGIETAARNANASDADTLPDVPPPPTSQPIAPVVIAPPRRELPQARHFHGGVLRLFGITGLICAGLFGYWLATGKPEIRSAVTYLHKIPLLPSASRNEPATTAELGAPVEPPPVAQPSLQPAATDVAANDTPEVQAKNETAHHEQDAVREVSAETNATVRSLTDNPLITLNVACGTPPCGNIDLIAPRSARDGAANAGHAWWTSTYEDAPSTRVAAQAGTFANPRRIARPDTPARSSRALAASEYFERGMAQSKSGDPEGAIRDFTDAIRADPNFSNAYLQRGNMRFKNGSADQAIEDFREALRVEPRNAAAFKARGMAMLYKGDENSALEDLTRSIQIAEADPARLPVVDLFFARRSRAAMFARRQNVDRELFDLSAMIDAYWKNPDLADALKVNYGAQGAASLMATIYRQRAAIYVQRANNDGAIGDLSFALQLDPARALAVIIERARVQEAAGRREQAAADFQRVLEINPRFEEAKQALARLKGRS